MFVFAARAVTDDAASQVIRQKLNAQRIQSGARGRNLIEDFEAVSFVVHHFSDAVHLAGNAIDARPDFFGLLIVHRKRRNDTRQMSSRYVLQKSK